MINNYMPSDGNYYTGDTHWHSDSSDAGILHIKIAYCLDPLTRDTGSLRVIPGSHRFGDSFADALTGRVANCFDHWGVDGPNVPCVALETQPGDLVIFDHRTKHASYGGRKRRRMFTMNLCQRYPDDRTPDLKNYIARCARFWIDRAYGRKMMETAGPDRMRHLEQVMANDGISRNCQTKLVPKWTSRRAVNADRPSIRRFERFQSGRT